MFPETTSWIPRIRALRRVGFCLALVSWLLPTAWTATAAGETGADAARIRDLLTVDRPLVLGGVALPRRDLDRLYGGRAYEPLWVEDHELDAVGWGALRGLWNSSADGLDPARYSVGAIQNLLLSTANRDSAALDLLISAGLLRYVGDVSAGRLEPKASDPKLFVYPEPSDRVALLQGALAAPDLGGALRALAPPHEGYRRLREALAAFRERADRGGRPRVPEGPALKLGSRGPRVPALRRRLGAKPGTDLADGDVFDTALDRALRVFQRRHGLDDDGIVGPKTLDALNASIEKRIQQIQLNMERWRWLPRSLGRRHVMINAADFRLTVVEDGSPVLDMEVVVGRPYRSTPIFSSKITHMVLNPDWIVPPRIAGLDLLPKIRRDPGFLAAQNMEVLSGWSADAKVLDPQAVDWASVRAKPFPYKIRQKPGANNALGRVKFMLPNPYNVYLHDTPNRALFTKTARAFSSGCVRLSRPLELADYLLRDATDWSPDRIRAEISTAATRRVNLPVSISVYFTYFTAWVDDAGAIRFRNDVYGRDNALYTALLDQLIIQATAPKSPI